MNHSLALHARALTPTEAERLRRAIQQTSNITGYTTKELLRFSDVIVATIDSKFAGVCISIPLLGNWTDIALLYVFEEYRSQGVGTRLLSAAWDSATTKKCSIYITSRNPSVLRFMEEHDMVFRSLFSLPLPIQLHNLRFIFSLYRLREALRKSILNRELPPFRYGITKNGRP